MKEILVTRFFPGVNFWSQGSCGCWFLVKYFSEDHFWYKGLFWWPFLVIRFVPGDQFWWEGLFTRRKAPHISNCTVNLLCVLWVTRSCIACVWKVSLHVWTLSRGCLESVFHITLLNIVLIQQNFYGDNSHVSIRTVHFHCNFSGGGRDTLGSDVTLCS